MATCPDCLKASTDPRCGFCGAALQAGPFRTLSLLSESPHGRMYVAEDAGGQKVALKELAFALVPSAKTLDLFEREAQVLRALDHPAIPRFVASFSEGTGPRLRLYLAQELVEGETLLAKIQRGPLEANEGRTLALEVLQILDALHRRSPRLLHRDLKPSNLILRPDGRVALVDFGAARELLRDVTHGATFVGTFGYMPFEQMGGTVDERSDLYALGATLVHALTGVPPADLFGKSLSEELTSRAPHLSASFRGLLLRLLAPRREDRCRSAAEAIRLLQRSDALARTVVPEFPRIRRPRSWVGAVPYVGLLVVVAATSLWLVAVALFTR